MGNGKLEIGNLRLFYQGVVEADATDPAQVVARLGAVQAQDYGGALWAIGLRMKEATPAVVEQAVTDKKIVRTWLMRGTLHFVDAQEIRWMLKLLAPRLMNKLGSRHNQLELDDAVFNKSRKLIEKALEGGNQLTRAEIFKLLEDEKIPPTGQRGIHILSWFSQQSLLCHGPYRDKQPTFALLEEWLPPSREISLEEALAELAKRFFEGHGPATLADFARWASLKITDARRGLEMVRSELRREDAADQTYWMSAKSKTPPDSTGGYLLPGFDEFILGYKDRQAVLDPEYADLVEPGKNGIFMPTIVNNGRVVGLWKRATNARKNKITLTPAPFTSFTQDEKEGIETAAAHFSRFSGMPVEVVF